MIRAESEPSQNKAYFKKLNCAQHGNKFTYKCGYQHCSNPYLCSSPSCIEQHFHKENEGQLILTKFDSTEHTKKLVELQRVLNKEDFATEAKNLKAFIDQLKISMVNIYKDFRDLTIKKDAYILEMNKPFEPGFIQKAEETITIGVNLRKSIDALKARINLNGWKSPLNQIQKQDVPSNNQNHPFSFELEKKNGVRENDSKESVSDKNKILTNGQAPIELEKSSKSMVLSPLIVKEKPSNPVAALFKKPSTNDNFQDLFDTNKKPKENNEFLPNLEKKTVQNGTVSQTPTQNFVSGSQREAGQMQMGTKSDFKLDHSIDGQNLRIYERYFLMKKQLTMFLEKRLKNFSWGLCEQVLNSHQPYRTIEKFHEQLQGKKNLLFIFVGENRIIGSFYPSRYPRLVEKLRNDPNSFIFISNNEMTNIVEFRAVSCQFHLSVSDRLYICHGNTPSYADGLRSYNKGLRSMYYCLPSVSYKYIPDEKEEEVKTFNGTMNITEMFVLQWLGDQVVDLN